MPRITKDKAWLIANLTLRQFLQRYQGSLFGALWPFIAAGLQLAIYAFVFSVILKTKWQQVGISTPEQELPFWLVMFAGMAVFLFVSEVLTAAPSMITSVPNYVKKIRFPLAILPIVSVLVSSITTTLFFIILLIAIAVTGHLHWTLLYSPLIFMQAAFWCLGAAWILGAVGVFIKDLEQAIPFLVQLLMFLTPIFYPASAVPHKFKTIIMCNPLAYLVETFRDISLWGVAPQWGPLSLWTLISISFAGIGYIVFQHLRDAFADTM